MADNIFNMKIPYFLLTLLMFVLASGCSDSENGVPQNIASVGEGTAQVRVIHASADAPTVNVLADGELLGFLVGVDYQQASENFTVPSGNTYEFSLQANTTAGSIEVLRTNLNTLAGFLYDVVAVGSVADNTLELLTLSRLNDDLAVGNVRARVVHGAEYAPMLDVYITAVDADLISAQANTTLNYKDSSGAIELVGGEYQIRLTLAGSVDVIFDSGPVILPANAELVVLATQNVSAGKALVSLVVADGTGSTVILDKNTPVSIRVVHGVADAPAIDVIANNLFEIVGDVNFLSVTDYMDIATDSAGTEYLFDVTVAGDNTAVVIDDAAVSFESGQRYTAIAHNMLSNIDLDVVVDTPRRVATNAKIRLFHASSITEDVDIYITPDGNITDVEPGITDIPYLLDELAQTGYILLDEGDYVISVTLANSKTVLLESDMFSARNNQIYTAFIVNGETPNAAPNLILADDF